MTSVSHSEADAFLTCERKHYYGYGMKLEKQYHSSALNRGTAGHAVLEAFYNATLKGHDFDAALQYARDHFDNISRNPQGVGDEYNKNGTVKGISLEEILFTWYFPNEPFVRAGWEILAVEFPVSLAYDDEGNEFSGFIDLIAKDTEGRVYVIDHKFQYDFLSEQDVALQPQIKKYMAALRAMGLPADRGMYNQLRYRGKADLRQEDVVRTHQPVPPDKQIINVWREQVETARRVMERKALPIEVQSQQALRVANKMVCKSCSFKDLCIEDQRGGNTNIIIETEYQTKKRREPAQQAFIEDLREQDNT